MSSTKPHLCLTGGWYSSRNIGDQAILLGLTDALAAGLGPTKISIITANPAKVREEYGYEAFAPKQTPVQLARNLAGADALIYTGGTPFFDVKHHMAYYASLAAIARAKNIPILVFGISMRALESAFSRSMMKLIVRWADLLGAREEESLEEFRRWSDHSVKAQLVPDAATQMAPCSPEEAGKLLSQAGVNLGVPRVSICLRQFPDTRKFERHHADAQHGAAIVPKYRQAFAALAKHIVRNHDHDVVMCPMHTAQPDDDRVIAAAVREAVDDPGIRRRIHLLERQYGPREMKGMLGTMNANVGVRFHSLVLGTSMLVPSMTVGYARKNRAFMHYLGFGEFSHELASTDESQLLGTFDQLMQRGSRFLYRLKQRYAAIDLHYRHQVELLAEIMRQHGRLPAAPPEEVEVRRAA